MQTSFFFGQEKKTEKPVKVDRFRFHFDMNASATSFRLLGTSDIGNGDVTLIDGYPVTKEPVYKYVKKRIFGANFTMHIGFNIPFYRTETWSVGVKTNIGVGFQRGILAEDFSSVIFDLPQYAYYRNYKNKFDYTIFAGYKYTLAPISYGLFIVGFDYNLNKRNAVRVFISPLRRTYYSKLTNGDLQPIVRVVEFGVGFVF